MKKIKLYSGRFAKVDDCDFDKLSKFTWSIDASGYAKRFCGKRDKQKAIYMHKVVLIPRTGYVSDHINRDKLDNRRCNLRLATITQNNQNRGPIPNSSSKYKGVSWDKRRGIWSAKIRHSGKPHWLGYFKSEKEAAKAYDLQAKKYHGKFAYLNFKTGGQNEKE